MMNVIKGDLLKRARAGDFNVIVHGCNCFETMGSGIARQIREEYPEAYEADKNYSFAGDYNKLGNYSVMLGKSFNIINAYTQFGFNRGGQNEDVFEYTSFDMILQKLAHQYPTCKFGFPFIGMGLAGGDAERIVASLEWFTETVEKTGGSVTLVEYSVE